MRTLLPALLGILLNFVPSAMMTNAAAAEIRPQPVGQQSAHFEDATRRNWSGSGARPLETLIWYPAAAGTQEADWEVAIFKAGRNAKGAAMANSPAKLPLIVLSHGTGGAAMSLAWLGETLAANGYIVAAVNHHGNTGAEPTQPLQGTLVWWDRPRDLSVLIDRLLADPQLGPRIDSSRIGVAGFSIGGNIALASVGARLSRAQWQKFYTDAATARCRCNWCIRKTGTCPARSVFLWIGLPSCSRSMTAFNCAPPCGAHSVEQSGSKPTAGEYHGQQHAGCCSVRVSLDY